MITCSSAWVSALASGGPADPSAAVICLGFACLRVRVLVFLLCSAGRACQALFCGPFLLVVCGAVMLDQAYRPCQDHFAFCSLYHGLSLSVRHPKIPLFIPNIALLLGGKGSILSYKVSQILFNYLGGIEMSIITGEEGINNYRILALRSGLGLEMKGIKVHRGPTCYAMIKKEFGFKGSREKVHAQISTFIEDNILPAEVKP